MRSREEIARILHALPPSGKTNFLAMTYEQGIEEALMWVREELTDDEFEYGYGVKS